jgi:hypothetical protein
MALTLLHKINVLQCTVMICQCKITVLKNGQFRHAINHYLAASHQSHIILVKDLRMFLCPIV